MADEENTEVKEKKGISGLKLFLIVILPILLMSGTGAGLYFAGVFGGGDAAVSEEGDDAEATGDEEEVVAAAIYVPLEPPFVVNFADAGDARFLQITVEVMTRDPLVQGYVTTHMPAIRNNLVLLYSSQTSESVSTLEGKETLREETLSAIQEILETETGDPGIESVYFTSFVMQ